MWGGLVMFKDELRSYVRYLGVGFESEGRQLWMQTCLRGGMADLQFHNQRLLYGERCLGDEALHLRGDC